MEKISYWMVAALREQEVVSSPRELALTNICLSKSVPARQPFQFHHEDWITRMKRREDCEVIGMDAGHWMYIDRKEEFLQHMDAFFGRCDEKQ